MPKHAGMVLHLKVRVVRSALGTTLSKVDIFQCLSASCDTHEQGLEPSHQLFFLLWTLDAQLVAKGREPLTHPLALESIWGSRYGEWAGGCRPSSDRAPVLVCVDDGQGPRKSPLMHPHRSA